MKNHGEILARILSSTEERFPRICEKFCRIRLESFLAEQLEWGTRLHIIAKGSFADSLERQVSDSIELLGFAERHGALDMKAGGQRGCCSAADIGSGYGFPGVVWKIIRPDIVFSLFERKEKAALFLERTIRRLELSGISVKGEAAADPGTGHFDLALSKAAGRLSSILPLADRLLTPSGLYVTIKEREWKWELEDYSGGMEVVASEPLEDRKGALLLFGKGEGAGRGVSRETEVEQPDDEGG